MIIYTPMPHELIFENEAKEQLPVMEIDYMGIPVQVQLQSAFSCRVERIISTNPDDYLDPRIQPGAVLHYSPSEFAR
ncbi:YlzJ-like family protein [Peribacillus deserti]|uniref:Ribonuclease n=1 Tax=Peribacillus deserti TaxID=673318 RepID=A0A2N5MB85_9BACI|nr:YlzJ-like family protein [Peribacillus deserti]PLT31603.1 ribonuclease [Peribacillus deserti]